MIFCKIMCFTKQIYRKQILIVALHRLGECFYHSCLVIISKIVEKVLAQAIEESWITFAVGLGKIR